jgi:hypothetical protein
MLSKTVNGHLQSHHDCKQQQQYDSTGQKQKETTKYTKNQFRLRTLKHEFLNISVSLQTAFVVKTRLAEGQWLEEQANMLKFRLLQVGTRRQTVSRTEEQHFVPLKTFIKNRASK